MRLHHFLIAGALATLVPSVVLAQAADPQKASAAQALFDQAVADMDAKKFATACPRLEEATKLVPDAIGAKAQLAQCYEGWGHKASAWSEWNVVAAQADKQNQGDRATKARARMDALKPGLATLTISVSSDALGLNGIAIARDGTDIGKAQLGIALPVDAGAHAITVNAPGYQAWSKNVTVTDGAKLVIDVPALVQASGSHVEAPASTGRPRKWQAPLGVGAMVVGGVGLVVGGVLGGAAISKNSASNSGPCNTADVCSGAGLNDRSQAIGLGNASTALFIAGGVVAAAGVVLFVTAPKNKAADAALLVGPGRVGLAWEF